MDHNNANFKSVAVWQKEMCCNLNDVINKTRCLEDIATPVIRRWHVADSGADAPKPSVNEITEYREYDLLDPNNKPDVMDGWIAARLSLPMIAQYTSCSMGKWEFEFSGPYDPDVYYNDTLVEKSVFMRKNLFSANMMKRIQPMCF